MDKIDVVMLTYNINDDLVQLTRNTMYSLRQSNMGRLIVVDNASPLGAGAVRSESDIYIRNRENLGYPAAVNQGMSLARTEFVAIANNDIRVSSNWVEVALDILKDPKVVSVHFKMIPYDEPMALGGDVWDTGKERWCHASFYVIRKSAIKDGFYFDGYKEGGMDDWDLQHRLRHVESWKTVYTNKAVFQHMDSSTYMALDARDGNRSERDKRNAEIFKERWGDYAENIWAKLYPEQMTVPWKPFP